MVIVSWIVFLLSVVVSVLIWALGAGVPETTHYAMGAFFVLLNLTALLLLGNPPRQRRWIGLVAALLIVPIEILSIFILAMIE